MLRLWLPRRLDVTEQCSFDQVGRYFPMDSQFFMHDQLNRIGVKGGKLSDSPPNVRCCVERWKFHAANFRRIDLSITADDPKVSIEQRRVK
jgi:hypothetical protein